MINLEKILDNLPIAVAVTNSELEILYYNKKLFDTFSPYLNIQKNISFGFATSCRNCFDEKCNNSNDCFDCEIRTFFAEIKDDEVGKKFDKTLKIQKHDKILQFDCTVSKYKEDYILVFNDITAEILNLDSLKFFANDIEKAKHIQNNFLPSKTSGLPLVDFDYFYNQQYGVGGDFFDIYKIDSTHFGVYIADVSGTGISSSMITIFLKNNFDKTELSPARAIQKLATAYSLIDQQIYITIFAMVFDTANHRFYFCNGGHNQKCYIKQKDGIKSYLQNGRPIANFFDIAYDYQDKVGYYQRGDKLVLYTDGLADMKNPKGEYYGDERLETAVRISKHSLSEMLNFIAKDFVDFSGDNKLNDDFTLLILDLIK